MGHEKLFHFTTNPPEAIYARHTLFRPTPKAELGITGKLQGKQVQRLLVILYHPNC
jgi:hypothetical protein